MLNERRFGVIAESGNQAQGVLTCLSYSLDGAMPWGPFPNILARRL